MKKEKLTKAKYRKPTIEVFPLPGECSILAGTGQQLETVKTNCTLKSYSDDKESIRLNGGCITITSDDGEFNVSEVTFGDNK